MPSVEVHHNRVDAALAVLKRKVTDLGILEAVKAKEFYEKPTAKRKRKKNAAIRRARAEQLRQEL